MRRWGQRRGGGGGGRVTGSGGGQGVGRSPVDLDSRWWGVVVLCRN